MKIIKYTLILTILFLFSCSSDNDGCNEILEPRNNQFTFECQKINISSGRLNIEDPRRYPNNRIPEVFNASISLINSRNGADFNYYQNSSNINLVYFSISVPEENARNRNIPSGTYNLKKNEFADEAPFEITSAKFAINSSMEIWESSGDFYFVDGSSLFWEFEDIEVIVQKDTNNIYHIEFTLINNGKTMKGNFTGNMSVIDTWNK